MKGLNIMINFGKMYEIVFGPSGECKTESMLRTAKKLGLKVINIKCVALTEQDRNGVPQ